MDELAEPRSPSVQGRAADAPGLDETDLEREGVAVSSPTIRRFGNTSGIPGIPVISQAVAHGGVVYLCGVTPDPEGDVRVQTAQVLRRVDRLLERMGTDKSRLLTAQVWLADMRDFTAHNEAWNEWVDAANPPVRACVEARLWVPNMLVEVMVTAAA